MVSRADIVKAARAYQGTPFRHQGRARGAGVDCIGLLVGTARDAGLEVVDRADYPRQPVPAELIAGLSANLDRIEVDEARAGDVLVFWIIDPATLPPEKRSETPQHVGMLTDAGMIHAWSEGRRAVVEHGLTQGWRSRIHSAWRFRGLED